MRIDHRHNRESGSLGGRATKGWPRRDEVSGSEQINEHGEKDIQIFDGLRWEGSFDIAIRTPRS